MPIIFCPPRTAATLYEVDLVSRPDFSPGGFFVIPLEIGSLRAGRQGPRKSP